MTKRERQIQSMLNYYGIDMGGTRDEKMNKKEKQKFLDSFLQNYDARVVEDVLSKLKDKLDLDKPESGGDPENDDPFFDSLKKNEDDAQKESFFPLDMNSLSGRKLGLNEGQNPFGLNPDIERFIMWISDVLYSADHKVIITEENGETNIKLQKIKKRGGRKK